MQCAKRYGAPTIRTVLRTRDKKRRSCSPMLVQPRELLRTMLDMAIGAASPKLRIPAHLPQRPKAKTTLMVVLATSTGSALVKCMLLLVGKRTGNFSILDRIAAQRSPFSQ